MSKKAENQTATCKVQTNLTGYSARYQNVLCSKRTIPQRNPTPLRYISGIPLAGHLHNHDSVWTSRNPHVSCLFELSTGPTVYKSLLGLVFYFIVSHVMPLSKILVRNVTHKKIHCDLFTVYSEKEIKVPTKFI